MYIQNVAAVIFPILFMRASASPFASPEALALAEAMALALPAPYAMPVHGSTSTPSVPTTHGTTPAPPSTHGTTPAPPSTPAAPTPPQTNTGPHQNDLDITQLDNPKKPKKPTDAARQKENDEHAALDAGVKELGIEGKPIGAREGPHENPPGDLHVTGNVAHDDGTTSGFHVGVQQTGADPTTGAMRHEIQPVATNTQVFPNLNPSNTGKYEAGNPATRPIAGEWDNNGIKPSTYVPKVRRRAVHEAAVSAALRKRAVLQRRAVLEPQLMLSYA